MTARRPAVARTVRLAGTIALLFGLASSAPGQGMHAPTNTSSNALGQDYFDALTNATTEAMREKNYADGLIDFSLIRQTYIKQGPPQFAPALKALDGKTVRVIGFMNPYDSIETMKHCLIWETQRGCYFCQPPGFLEAIYVHQKVKGDEKLPFIDGLVLFTGKLRLWKDENDYLFLLEDAKAEPYKPPSKKHFWFF